MRFDIDKTNNLNTIRVSILAIFLTWSLNILTGQDSDQTTGYAIISQITIEGNKKTKDRVILREMDVAIGDTINISDISKILLRNRQYIFNTSLFQSVEINIKNWNTESNTLDLEIIILEDWYIYPIPIFSLADRNFNVWIKEFGASLKRTSYGMRFYHFNTTGNRDRTKVLAQFGYEKRFELGYDRPNFNKTQTMGWNNSIRYRSRKEIFYSTLGNKQEFLSNDTQDQFDALRIRSQLTFRPKINQYHTMLIDYVSNSVSDTIVQHLNPDYYLGSNDNSQEYFKFKYTFVNDQRNFRTYPTKGSYYQGSINKEGVGIFGDVDILNLDQTYAKYFELSPKLSFESLARVKYSINRKKPPFANYRGIGFSQNNIRGYELYVIDALDFGYISTSFRYQILKKEFKIGRMMPISSFRTMPIQLMFTFNNDLGYTNDPYYSDTNSLNNRWLWGGGIGIDMMLYNDYVFQIEYNFNQLSESGIFIKVKLPF